MMHKITGKKKKVPIVSANGNAFSIVPGEPISFLGKQMPSEEECTVSLIFSISVTSIMRWHMKLSDKVISAFLWHLLFGNATVFWLHHDCAPFPMQTVRF